MTSAFNCIDAFRIRIDVYKMVTLYYWFLSFSVIGVLLHFFVFQICVILLCAILKIFMPDSPTRTKVPNGILV